MNGKQQKRRGDGRESFHIWPWLVFPILPLLGGLVVLHVSYAESFSFAAYEGALAFIATEKRGFVHFESLMVYVSVAYFHVALCILASVYAVFQIRSFPDPIQKHAWRLVIRLFLALIAVGLIARIEGSALELTYRNTCELLRIAEVSPHLVPDTCRGGPPSLFVWLTGIPVLAGLIAAVLATAAVSAAAGPLAQHGESDWRQAFARRAAVLQQSFYIASMVLVTSTVSIMLFLQLPLTIADEGLTTMVVGSHARAMTVFWGTVFTLTLLAIVAPSAFLMNRAAERHAAASEAPSEVRDWLKTHIAVSVPKRLGNIAAVLAPLLVGPAGALLEKLGGG